MDSLRLQFDEYVSQFAEYDFNELAEFKNKMDHSVTAYDANLTKIGMIQSAHASM